MVKMLKPEWLRQSVQKSIDKTDTNWRIKIKISNDNWYCVKIKFMFY